MSEPILTATDLTLSFGVTPALRGVDFAVQAGEIVAVTGPSGAGKSTLLLCLAGIIRPDSGAVQFRGERIDTRSEADRSRLRRRDFGFVFQFGQLVPELPAVENVALPLLLDGTPRADATGRAAQWMERLGVAGLADQVPGELSGGEQQKIAVARALVSAPAVIYADEPTGALDSVAGEDVMLQLTGLARAERTAVVLVTHEPRVAAYASREVRLRDGLVSAPAASRS
jgi:putative ABC transport system ATP-binding protein